MSEAGGAVEPIALIVVRAGAIDRFAALRSAFAPEGVDVVWDRRSGERRRLPGDPSRAGEHRRRERRGPTPASWDLLDFLVAPARPRAS